MIDAEGQSAAAPGPPEALMSNSRQGGWRSTLQEAATLIGVALTVVGVAVLVRLVEPDFFLWGDNAESFFPLWHRIGSDLRDGVWTPLVPDLWMGGNLAAEATFGILHPLVLGDAVMVSMLGDLRVAAAWVMVQWLVLAAWGVYLLAREVGASRAPAWAVGVAFSFSGFTLFYGASNWASGLVATTGAIFFWWAGRRLVRGAGSPLVAFVLGSLAVLSGNPYGAVGVVVVLVALAVEALVAKTPRLLAHLLVVGACLGAVAALVYLPLYETLPVTWRADAAVEKAGSYLVPDLGDLAAMSMPTFRPTMPAWLGLADKVPSTYLAWFVVPLLPWLRWRVFAVAWRSLLSVYVVGGVYLMLTFAPSTLGPFRWPVRMVEYLYVAVLVGLAAVASRGLVTRGWRVRAALSLVAVSAAFYLAWAADPDRTRAHLLVLGMLCGLLLLAGLAWRVTGPPGVAAVGLVGVVALAPLQAGLFWWRSPENLPVTMPHDLASPSDLTRVRAGAAAGDGTTLQVAGVDQGLSAHDLIDGRFMFGHLWAASGVPAVNAYTGIGYLRLSRALTMDYRGKVDPVAYGRLWESPVPGGPALADLLRLGTVSVQSALVSVTDAPPGWYVAEDDGRRVELRRAQALPENGRVAAVTDGTTATSVASSNLQQRLTVEVQGESGTVTLALLAWPGYTATLDGAALDVGSHPVGLVQLTVPSGAHEVTLTFWPPGWSVALPAVAVAAAVALLQGLLWLLLRQCRPPARPRLAVVAGT